MMPRSFSVPPVWIPKPAYWENFLDSWTQYNFNTYMFNTIVRYAIPVSIAAVLSNAIVAYGFSRLNWPGRDILFFVCLSTLMIPFPGADGAPVHHFPEPEVA